jgi:hypothetical protein
MGKYDVEIICQLCGKYERCAALKDKPPMWFACAIPAITSDKMMFEPRPELLEEDTSDDYVSELMRIQDGRRSR